MSRLRPGNRDGAAVIPLYKFVDLCLAQKGDKYIFGAEAARTDPNPEAFDCSELIEWAMESLGFGDFPDGSMNQRAFCEKRERLTVTEATKLRGALLFRDVSVNGVGPDPTCVHCPSAMRR